MKPDRTNYEIWLIDYLDGILDETQAGNLISFIEENPDLKEEFIDVLSYKTTPVKDSFKHRNILKKTSSDLPEKQFEYLCISASENDLSNEQKEEFDEIIAGNAEKRKTHELFCSLKLVAPSTKFNKKTGLRKLTLIQKVVRYSVAGISAAATITILISLFNMPPYDSEETPTPPSAILALDLNIEKASPESKIPEVMIEKKNETKLPKKINVLSGLQKAVSKEMNEIPVVPAETIMTLSARDLVASAVSKISFKNDFHLKEKEFRSELVFINTSETETIKPEVRHSINELFAKVFRDKILKDKTTETGELRAYEVADASITGLNKLLGWEMSLQKTRDEKGDLKSLYFSSKILKFNAPVKKVSLYP
jgi:hypothetical protein